jgi:hypothetical protein
MGEKRDRRAAMIRVNIICEGFTEEQFVNQILQPHFQERGIFITARTLGRGNSYGKLRYNIVQWMKSEKGAYVTTLIDLYGINSGFPGYDLNKNKQPLDKVAAIENAVQLDIDKEGIDQRRFIPHFQLHEFEALLFSEPELMQEWLSLDHKLPEGAFQQIRNKFETPEHINDDPLTAPSKRIKQLVREYDKVADGVLIAEDIGLEKMRAACPHFDTWMNTIESLEPL